MFDLDRHPTPYTPPRWRGFCRRVVDGDTYRLEVDCGFRITFQFTLRLALINTPEIFRPMNELEKEHGLEAKEFAESLVLGQPIQATTYRPDPETFGRFLGEVYWLTHTGAWEAISQTLQASGYAKDVRRYTK